MGILRVVSGAFFFSCVLFFLLGGIPPTGARERLPDSAPDRPSCERLYAHQLRLFKKKENPIATVIKLNDRSLSSPRSRKAQIEWCLNRETWSGYECQMKARTLRELLVCQSRRDGHRQGKIETDSTVKKEDGGESRISVIKEGEKSSIAVTAKRCKKAYNHLLGIYAKSERFLKRPDAERLLKHWRSEAARSSFELRCRRVFRGEDLNCILSTTDTVIIQGCLFRVPPPASR